MKKTILYSVIISLLIVTVLCIVLKYNYEKDFLQNESQGLHNLIINVEETNLEQQNEISKIANDYKYHIYIYNILAFVTFTTSMLLIFKRKKILLD